MAGDHSFSFFLVQFRALATVYGCALCFCFVGREANGAQEPLLSTRIRANHDDDALRGLGLPVLHLPQPLLLPEQKIIPTLA